LNDKILALGHSRAALALNDHVKMRFGYIQTLVSLREFRQAEVEIHKLHESDPDLDCKSLLESIFAAKGVKPAGPKGYKKTGLARSDERIQKKYS